MAIRLDQRRVDAMPIASFHPMYDAQMWRDWRGNSVGYIEQLLASINAIPDAMLAELTKIATSYQPLIVREVVPRKFRGRC